MSKSPTNASEPVAQSGPSAAVVFRFRDATIPGHWSRWLPMDDLHHYGKDGNLVSGPHPDWAVEYAYPPAGERDAVIDALRAVKQWNDVSQLEHEWPIIMEMVNSALTGKADGPDYPDGHDHEGFPGGCERFGHTPNSCPQATQPAAPGAGEPEAARVRRMVGDPRRGVTVPVAPHAANNAPNFIQEER